MTKHLAAATTLALAVLAAACSTAGGPAGPATAIPSTSAMPAAVTSAAAMPASSARWTFDGDIRNNSLAISPDERTAVVSYSRRPDVVVYDLEAGRVRGVLPGYVTPRNIVFAPTGSEFMVSDSSLGTVQLVDTATLRTTAALPVGYGAFGTVASADGGTLWINNQAASTVTRFDLVARQPRAVVTGFAQPRQGVRLSPDGRTLYVTNFLGDKVTIVDVATNRIAGEVTGFQKLRAISITADGGTMYAANSGSNTVAVVDLARRAIVQTIAVGRDPYGAALAPDGRQVYVGNLADQTVSVIDTASRSVVATIAGFKEPRQAIVFTRDGRTAYVLNEDLSVAKVDRATQRVVATLAAPAR